MRSRLGWVTTTLLLLGLCFRFGVSFPAMNRLFRIAARRATHSHHWTQPPPPTHHIPRSLQNYQFRPHPQQQVRSSVAHAATSLRTDHDGEVDNNNRLDNISLSATTSVTSSVELESTKTEATNDNDVLLDGLSSRPVPGGNWDPAHPLKWQESFGSRSQKTWEHLQPLIQLHPGDEGYHPVPLDEKMDGVVIVRTKEQAQQVLEKLNAAPSTVFHACDTEVMEIDLTEQGPVGNGYVTCLSIYSGPDFDYGQGPGKTLWIDNLDDACGVLQEFKEWLENDQHYKVWHNYGFDRHVLWNEGILVKGFGGDTMHMARLQDTSRGGYSLEVLTDTLLDRRKQPMKELFGVRRHRKDGSDGLLVDIPPVSVLQRDPDHRLMWIKYSCYDAEGTWLLRQELQKLLEAQPWILGKNLYEYYQMHMRPFGEVLTDMERRGIRVDAHDYLATVERQARKDRQEHLVKFRQWAESQIGPDGLALNVASSVQLRTFLFGGSENFKTKERTEALRTFRVLRDEITDEAMEAYRKRDEMEREQSSPEQAKPYKDEIDGMTVAQLKALCKEYGLGVAGKKDVLKERLRGYLLLSTQDDFQAMSDDDLRDACKTRSLSEKGTRSTLLERLRADTSFCASLLAATPPQDSNGYQAISKALEDAAKKNSAINDIWSEVKSKSEAEPKYVDITIRSIGMTPEKFTLGGAPSVTADVLRTLAGDPFDDPPRFGTAFDFFGGGDQGREACEALFSLVSIGSIDTMIATFLTSLQLLADDQSRVHCSLNLNTETGRLSSRRPNLQNQPALEKDKYKIRQAFQSSPGNNLIVADYGQLELRLLASMTNCESMINAFHLGGDFHSRTALDMFPYIKEALDNDECLLEWDYSQGQPPKPLLKDMFASERRKAKTLNFSIAYGKTAHGLSQDWGVSKKEANDMLDAWYAARPEVQKWQKGTKQYARQEGLTRTLMGRYRQLPDAKGTNLVSVGHAERASINTPIQGGAADIAMMAMIKINTSEKLKRLGWILLLQIHDEVVLEGPEETAQEAFEEVVQCMEEPWVFGLQRTRVPLLVDGSYNHKTWYDAK